MTKTNTKTATAIQTNLRKGITRRQLKATCTHPTTIKCDDFQVCTVCEKVW